MALGTSVPLIHSAQYSDHSFSTYVKNLRMYYMNDNIENGDTLFKGFFFSRNNRRYTSQKNEVFYWRFPQQMWPNLQFPPQFPADLVIFTEEILNGKLHLFVHDLTSYRPVPFTFSILSCSFQYFFSRSLLSFII